LGGFSTGVTVIRIVERRRPVSAATDTSHSETTTVRHTMYTASAGARLASHSSEAATNVKKRTQDVPFYRAAIQSSSEKAY
jgi:hypothetical protein